MSKQSKIRWKQSDEEKLRKTVRNFNAKIRRLEKKDPKNKAALPEKISVKDLKEVIHTRADLNRELNSLKRFSKRGSETLVVAPESDYNVLITKWQKQEINRRVGMINRKREERRKMIADIEMQQKGKDLGYKKGDFGMGKLSDRELMPMNKFTPKSTHASIKAKWKSVMKESSNMYWEWRDDLHKQNYIKSLTENFNENDVKDVIKAIEDMDYNEFRKVFEANGGNFELSYPPDEEQYYSYLSEIKTIWTPDRKEE